MALDLEVALKILGSAAGVLALIGGYTSWLLGKISEVKQTMDQVLSRLDKDGDENVRLLRKEFKQDLIGIHNELKQDVSGLHTRINETRKEMATKEDLKPLAQYLTRIDSRIDQILILLQGKT